MVIDEKLRLLVAETACCKKAIADANKQLLRYLAPVPGADLPSQETILSSVAQLGAHAQDLLTRASAALNAIQPPLPFVKTEKKDA